MRMTRKEIEDEIERVDDEISDLEDEKSDLEDALRAIEVEPGKFVVGPSCQVCGTETIRTYELCYDCKRKTRVLLDQGFSAEKIACGKYNVQVAIESTFKNELTGATQ